MGKKKKSEDKTKIDEILETSRRNFIKKAGVIGAGSLAAGAAIYSGYRFENAKKNSETIRVLTEDNRLVEIPRDQVKDIKSERKALQTRGREGIKGKKWVMVIDLSRCRNARKCVGACQSAHHLRPYEYHINTLAMQESENTPAFYMPKPCQHCDNPPCVSVCPVDATYKRQDGIVLIDNERCIGCRFCMAACPYGARSFNFFDPRPSIKKEGDNYPNLEFPTRTKGVVEKCTFCYERLAKGLIPACVEASEKRAKQLGTSPGLIFGDLDDPHSEVRKILEERYSFRRKPELGTGPSVYYLI